MRLAAVFAVIFCAGPVWAADASLTKPVEVWEADRSVVLDATEIDVDTFQWLARPVVVFADTPADPRFVQQLGLLTVEGSELAQRDVVIITDTDPDAKSELRERLRPRGFMLVLIGKDGGVKLRKPLPYNVRELSRSIDKTPLRKQEIQDRRGLN